jgi:hypothetical protein
MVLPKLPIAGGFGGGGAPKLPIGVCGGGGVGGGRSAGGPVGVVSPVLEIGLSAKAKVGAESDPDSSNSGDTDVVYM